MAVMLECQYIGGLHQRLLLQEWDAAVAAGAAALQTLQQCFSNLQPASGTQEVPKILERLQGLVRTLAFANASQSSKLILQSIKLHTGQRPQQAPSTCSAVLWWLPCISRLPKLIISNTFTRSGESSSTLLHRQVCQWLVFAQAMSACVPQAPSFRLSSYISNLLEPTTTADPDLAADLHQAHTALQAALSVATQQLQQLQDIAEQYTDAALAQQLETGVFEFSIDYSMSTL